MFPGTCTEWLILQAGAACVNTVQDAETDVKVNGGLRLQYVAGKDGLCTCRLTETKYFLQVPDGARER